MNNIHDAKPACSVQQANSMKALKYGMVRFLCNQPIYLELLHVSICHARVIRS